MTLLSRLFDQNVAWVHRKTQDDPTFFVRMAEQQTPNYLWIGCSDSRVTANDVLGLDPGEVFVQRNIANIVHTSDMNVLSVLEFAVDVLKVEHIIVCGHYGCGGVQRALGQERSALVDHWLQPIVMLYRKHRKAFDAVERHALHDWMCELNVELQVRRVASIPTVENAWARGQHLHIHGWIYGVHDGLLRDVGLSLSSARERDEAPTIDECVLQRREPISSMRDQAIEAFSPDKGDCC